jgi:hypothetical protein
MIDLIHTQSLIQLWTPGHAGAQLFQPVSDARRIELLMNKMAEAASILASSHAGDMANH